jgi:hypothetical protein
MDRCFIGGKSIDRMYKIDIVTRLLGNSPPISQQLGLIAIEPDILDTHASLHLAVRGCADDCTDRYL